MCFRPFLFFLFLFLGRQTVLFAMNEQQEQVPKELKVFLNASGEHYIKATVLSQVWIRYVDHNPGSTLDGYPLKESMDIGLRRVRMQLSGQLTDRVFFYMQAGLNNIAYNSPRKQGFFLHDALIEYRLLSSRLQVGAGLSGWSGLSRYASPAAGSILTLDVPLYQQATADVSDQFLRKFSIYTKGKLGSVDYRLALTKPMSAGQASVSLPPISRQAGFASTPPFLQYQGYVMYQFRDRESNLLPYNTGTYLGKKDVFNIGMGFIFQQDAMWNLTPGGADTQYSHLRLFALDIFYDRPVNRARGTAFTLYSAISLNDYGRDYIRNLGVMNPADGTDGNGSRNGPGNAYPMMGTGTIVYGQGGWLFRRGLLGKLGTLQPYMAVQYADYRLIPDPAVAYHAGINWLLDGHRAKLSLDYQSRPVYDFHPGGWIQGGRKGMMVTQLQVAL